MALQCFGWRGEGRPLFLTGLCFSDYANKVLAVTGWDLFVKLALPF